MDICKRPMCGHRKDSHRITPDGYFCVRCECKRRFWR